MSSNFIKGIIGDGFLTEVLLTAFTRRIGIDLSEMYVLAKTSGRCQELLEQFNVHAVQNPMVFVPPAKLLILAVELEDAPRIMKQISDKVSDNVLIMSIIPGLKLNVIEHYFPNHMIIRMLMNPWIVNGYGVSTYVVGDYNPSEAINVAKSILDPLGETITVDSEDELEIIGELISADTFYSYILVKSLIKIGENAGLSNKKAIEVVMKILSSSARAMNDTDAVTDSLLERSYNKGQFLERSRALFDKYEIFDQFRKTFDSALEEKNFFRLHYR